MLILMRNGVLEVACRSEEHWDTIIYAKSDDIVTFFILLASIIIVVFHYILACFEHSLVRVDESVSHKNQHQLPPEHKY